MTAKENIDAGNPIGGVLSEPPIVQNKIDDDRVLRSALLSPNLVVNLDGLSNATLGGSATLFLNKPDGTRKLILTKPLDGISQPLSFELPTSEIPELPTPADPTVYTVDFEVFDGDGNDDHSTVPTPLRVDLTPPWQTKSPFARVHPPVVRFVNAPANGILDRAWFTANPGGLQCIADVSYPFRNVLDTFRFYLSPRSAPTTTLTPVYEGTVSTLGAFTVPLAMLTPLGNTTLFSINTVEDRVGNRSIDSVPFRNLEIRLPPAPTLFAPTLPVTGVDGSLPITLANYNPIGTQVFVEIRRPTNGDVDDILTVSLGGRELGTVRIEDATTTPLRIALTYDICDVVFGNATAEITTLLSYKLSRLGNPDIPSPETTVFLNLIYPGPVLIPEPDLESVNLLPAEVRGVTKTLNHIVPADFGQPIIFRFNKWGMDLGDDLISQAIVSFYYNGKFIGDQTIDPGEDFCEFEAAFKTIADEGLGKKDAYYTLEYPGNPNIVRQKDLTEVTFESIEVNLKVHEARTYNTDKAVSCPALDLVAGARIWKVTAPAQAIFTPGLNVILTAQGYEEIEKVTPIGVPFTQPVAVVTSGAAVDFTVPFSFLRGLQGPIMPPDEDPNFNYMEVWYSITISGAPYDSPKVLHRVNVRNSSSLFCDGTL